MNIFQLFLQILAALGPILNTPLAAKILTCISTQSGFAAILACVTAQTPAAGPETDAHAKVVDLLKMHIAANP